MSVLGVGISPVDLESAVARVGQWVTEGSTGRGSRYVCVTGVHGVMESQRDPDLREIHNRSGMTTPDGMPLVWSAHQAGAKWVGRVYGPDLMLKVLERAESEGWSSYFFGGKPGVPETLIEQLRVRYPSLEVAGQFSPPFRPLTPSETAEIQDEINRSGADLVWVGLSTPKQERWMAENAPHLDAAALLGVGAAFDFHAGLVAEAPAWMQRSGLEWLFRLVKEPRRLWRRYLRNNPSFVVRVLRHRPQLVDVAQLAGTEAGA